MISGSTKLPEINCTADIKNATVAAYQKLSNCNSARKMGGIVAIMGPSVGIKMPKASEIAFEFLYHQGIAFQPLAIDH